MKNKHFTLILLTLFFSFHSSHSCDESIDNTTYLSQEDFTDLMGQKYPYNSLQWIWPEHLTSTTPEDHIWVKEGSAGYMTSPLGDKKGIATTGLLTCTAITAFSKAGYPALAHITDMTPPSNALAFLEKMDVDPKKSVTLISKTFNMNHLLTMKYWIEERSEFSPIIKTLPIFIDRNHKITTCLDPEIFAELKNDLRGISVAMNTDGNHTFFYQSHEEQEAIEREFNKNFPTDQDYTDLYITQFLF